MYFKREEGTVKEILIIKDRNSSDCSERGELFNETVSRKEFVKLVVNE
jgi:hypothetical protein